MALLLGIDTGGTYTDAVLVDDQLDGAAGVVASAKALTTPIDLSIGIGQAIDRVLAHSAASIQPIGLVSLSTTLATNALVERRGGRIALFLVGFDDDALDRAGLRDALDGDPVVVVAGGHDSHGTALAPLDIAAVEAGIDRLPGDVVGFAVAGQFAVRNPEHELAVRTMLRERTDKPVTCSHELSAKLDGPRRALTSVLNARLIGLIDQLLRATEGLLAERAITAPVMVVRGDGSLIAVEMARERPIETILSGPAASIVGAQALCGEQRAFISDIGGTTTDIAVLSGGQPQLARDGAVVGGLRTMVEAVDMRTIGLGGDSVVSINQSAAIHQTAQRSTLILGPRRCIPVSVFAVDAPELVHRTLDRQLEAYRVRELDGQFAVAQVETGRLLQLDTREEEVLGRLLERPYALDELVDDRRDRVAFERLVRRGHAQLVGFTPTDACHVLGRHDDFDSAAAVKAAALFARRHDRFGQPVAADAGDLATAVVQAMVEVSAIALLAAALEHDGIAEAEAGSAIALAALDHHVGSVIPSLALGYPIVALGASAGAYYPAIGAKLGAEVVCPDLGPVANAFGAVVGHVRCVVIATVSQLEEGPWRLYGLDTPLDFVSDEDALLDGAELARRSAMKNASDAGAADVEVSVDVTRRSATIEDIEVLIEATITATALGRPQLG